MTALSITASNVLLTNGPTAVGLAGEAVTAGMAVYKVAATGKWKKAQCDGTAAEAGADGYGIALNTADADGAQLVVALPGAVVAMGAGVAGVPYYIGNTAGALDPYADLGSTDKVVPICLGLGNSVLVLGNAYHASSVLA